MTLLSCPSCGGEMSLDVLLSHNELRQAMAALAEKSLPMGGLMLRYIGLFRPAKNRMSPDRWAKLILQLLPDVQRGAINHKGRDWAMPLDGWRAGLEAMLDKAASEKLTLPLENHNYLYTVLAGMADKFEAAQEQATEADRRTRQGPSVRPDQTRATPVLQAAARALGVPDHIKQEMAAIRRGEPIQRGENHD